MGPPPYANLPSRCPGYLSPCGAGLGTLGLDELSRGHLLHHVFKQHLGHKQPYPEGPPRCDMTHWGPGMSPALLSVQVMRFRNYCFHDD